MAAVYLFSTRCFDGLFQGCEPHPCRLDYKSSDITPTPLDALIAIKNDCNLHEELLEKLSAHADRNNDYSFCDIKEDLENLENEEMSLNTIKTLLGEEQYKGIILQTLPRGIDYKYYQINELPVFAVPCWTGRVENYDFLKALISFAEEKRKTEEEIFIALHANSDIQNYEDKVEIVNGVKRIIVDKLDFPTESKIKIFIFSHVPGDHFYEFLYKSRTENLIDRLQKLFDEKTYKEQISMAGVLDKDICEGKEDCEPLIERFNGVLDI